MLDKKPTDELRYHELKFICEQEFMSSLDEFWRSKQLENEEKQKWRGIMDDCIKQASLLGEMIQEERTEQHYYEEPPQVLREKLDPAIKAAAKAGKLLSKDPNHDARYTLEKKIDCIIDVVKKRQKEKQLIL